MKDHQETVGQNETETLERDDAVIGLAFWWSLLVIVVVAAISGGFYWWRTQPEPVLTENRTKQAAPKIREQPNIEIPQIPFTEITKQAGIDFVHENGAAGEKLLPETMGGGCAFLDYDNDGDADILFVNSTRWPWDSRPVDQPATMALYRNDGTGHFEDVTAEVGLDVSFYGMGVAVGDYDNDGYVDLFITTVGSNRLFRNVRGRFVDVTQTAGVAGDDKEWSTSAGWFDYDNDGDLDLFVCNYLRWSREIDIVQKCNLTGEGRNYCRPQHFEGTYPYLYRNDGDGSFTDASAKAGMQINNPATAVPMGKSLGVAFADFDDDGWLEVFVANDTVQNFLFHNAGNGTFRDIGPASGVAYDIDGNATGAMGADTAYFRNSREIGIAIGNFSNEMTTLYVSRNKELQFSDDAVSNGLGPVTRLELTFGLFFFDSDHRAPAARTIWFRSTQYLPTIRTEIL